jgi:hypothetical protein
MYLQDFLLCKMAIVALSSDGATGILNAPHLLSDFNKLAVTGLQIFVPYTMRVTVMVRFPIM